MRGGALTMAPMLAFVVFAIVMFVASLLLAFLGVTTVGHTFALLGFIAMLLAPMLAS